MNIKTFTFNPVGENTYVAYDDTKECIIIDPGCFYHDEEKDLLDFIVDNQLVIKHVINTHLHFDHTFGLNFIADQFKMQTEAHKDEQFLLEQLPAQYQMFGLGKYEGSIPQIGKYLEENDIITFGHQKLVAIHVPGHSPGSLCFYNEAAGCMFVGDVLFQYSVGRSDLVGGNHTLLIDGIKKKLLSLPKATIVYSGHGPTTTIGDESKNNSFLQ